MQQAGLLPAILESSKPQGYPLSLMNLALKSGLEGFSATDGSLAPTFARASTATAITNGAVKSFAINEPRVTEHGVLIEGASTNGFIESEDFSAAAWVNTNSVDNAAYATAPDGTLTATQLIDNEATGTGGVYITEQAITINSASDYAVSLFAKADQVDYLVLQTAGYDATGNGLTWFNSSTGALGTQSGNHSDAGIESIGNGWYRCYIVFQSTTDLTGAISIYAASADNSVTDDLDGTTSILIWGAQLEELAFPSSYIPTNGSTVTRAADSLSYDLTAASWFNTTGAGTIVFDLTVPVANDLATYYLSIDDGTYTERHSIYNAGANHKPSAIGVDGGAGQYSGSAANAVASGVPTTLALAWDTNDIAFYQDGAQAFTDSVATLPTVDTIHIMTSPTGSERQYGYIKNFRYYDYRVTNADLARLTG